MLLTLTTTHRPATDLGYLLGKNPARMQSFDLAFGTAWVFYPEATAERCTAALLLDLDPIDLVRNARRRKAHGGLLTQYVNDRPYAASSLMSAAISRVLGSALGGRSRERQALADAEIPLEIELSAAPARGGERLVRELFEPLGYEVETQREPLDPAFEEWGMSAYHRVTLRAAKRLADALSHLYVLIPVLDDDKHYWVGDDEVDKLLEKGRDWLATHPLREAITSRYLKRQGRLTREALARLTAGEEPPSDEAEEKREERLEEGVDAERSSSLNEQRIGAVLAALREARAARVIDLGCGEGKLLRALLADRSFERVAGMDVSVRSLEVAKRRLRVDEMAPRKRARLELFQGSLVYRDARLAGYDAACLVEVIEHMDRSRLAAFERVLFESARPPLVVVTTPNIEHNVRFATLERGALRHADHRFEWTRAEFAAWAEGVCERWGYAARFVPIGPDDAEVGPPTQMAVLRRGAES